MKPAVVIDKVEESLKQRYRAEFRFILYGKIAISIGLLALITLFVDIIGKGFPAFYMTQIRLTVHLNSAELGITPLLEAPNNTQLKLFKEQMAEADFDYLFKQSIYALVPEIKARKHKSQLRRLFSTLGPDFIKEKLLSNPALLDQTIDIWLIADDLVDVAYKADFNAASTYKFSPLQMKILKKIQNDHRMRATFNNVFFISGDSREPEQAGILGSLLGSLLTLLVTLSLSFPIGVAAATYLEEFAPKNRFTTIIEVNINNLAAVPSVIVGLLGLAIFINFFNLPRSTPLVGGMVLALMTLPTIIIASRAALHSIPPSIREAALGVGASSMQVVFHHLLPLALPGMLSGAILGMARALGETAPLLMIGMVAFIVDVPEVITDSATVLPVQIFLWSDSPERSFVEKTSAAIIVLLVFLMLMNATAVLLRKRLEKRW